MRDKIVITRNMAGFASLMDNLIQKPKRLDRMGLIFGKWDFGKSTAIEWIFANTPCFYVSAKAAWLRSVNMMVEDVLSAYRVEPSGRLKQDFRELIRSAKKNQAPLIIDEADRIVRKTLLIELIRDVHDFAKVPIVLVGQENIINLLNRRNMGAVYSRISEAFEFLPLTSQDIQQIAKELCDIDCDIRVASFIQTACLGDFRLVNTLLIRAENLCLLNKISGITITIAKKAASVLPDRDDMDRTAKDGRVIDDKSLKVA